MSGKLRRAPETREEETIGEIRESFLTFGPKEEEKILSNEKRNKKVYGAKSGLSLPAAANWQSDQIIWPKNSPSSFQIRIVCQYADPGIIGSLIPI